MIRKVRRKNKNSKFWNTWIIYYELRQWKINSCIIMDKITLLYIETIVRKVRTLLVFNQPIHILIKVPKVFYLLRV